MAQAKRDAATLRQHKSRDSSLRHILATRSWVQLKATFKIYKKKYSIQFDTDINSDIKWQWKWYTVAISAIYQYAMDSNTFFAKALIRDVFECDRLYASPGYALGVARVFTWRAEMDLGGITKAYKRIHWWTLVGDVKKVIIFEQDDINILVGILQ